ncbi:MAG: hypothetical protein IIU14_02540 [Ruminococcus sp.]|nr:hypothetical protein [Ruminococcus sp.]
MKKLLSILLSATLILSVFSIVSVSAVSGTTYYLFGYINGANYACEEDNRNMGEYKFENGMLTAKFDMVSYVAVKEENNTNWYMTNGWVGEVSSAELYNTSITGENSNKIKVPAGVDVTFTLAENADGSLTLSYQVAQQYEGQYRNELWDEVYIMSSDLYPENYTEDSYREFKKALEEAQAVLENLNSTDTELIKAKNNLVSAKNNLVNSAVVQTQATDNNAEFEPGSVIVSLKSNSPSVTSLLSGFDIEEARLITPGSDTQNIYLVRFKEKTKEIVWRAIDVLKNSQYVITAEPDYYQYIDDKIEETTSDNNSTEPTEPTTDKLTEPVTTEPTESSANKPTEPVTSEPTEATTDKPTEPVTTNPTESSTDKPTEPVTTNPTESSTDKPTEPVTTNPTESSTDNPTEPVTTEPTEVTTDKPTEPVTTNPTESSTDKPTEPVTNEPTVTEPPTDKQTEPAKTDPIVINPQPTENKPTTPTVVKPTVKKKANPINVTVKTKTIKAKKLKKKTQEVKVITVKNNQGKVTYKLVKSGITKKIRKLVSINKKGAITIKKWKKAKVGTYKIKVGITAKGNSKYKPKTLIKTVKIKLR